MKVELLAPAGSYESMVAAYQAGADAVYIGGTRFGARAFADNLDTEKMKQAIDYAHLREKKLYLTVNTLVKQKELEDVYEYLLPFYREGLDAVIVQDLGVFQLVRENFPGMDLHASTQMTVTGARGAAWLKERGASRVVTARELSLEEIRKIHDQVDVEIESFVHGALCFCYSGQCLLSSVIGGRSGNRGRCAQPCRLQYQLYDNQRQISEVQQSYLMSPKDMCTLDLIPEMIECGIDSFKMEGRMKRPEYTAGITAIYRKYIDRYLEYGKKNFHIREEDRISLMDLYNRGGFSTGYYRQHNGKDMMSMQRPNHWGTKAAKAVFHGGSFKWKALEELQPGDVLELRQKKETAELTLSQKIKKDASFTARTGKLKAQKDDILYRTKNEALLEQLKKEYIDTPHKVGIDGELILRKKQLSYLKIRWNNLTVLAEGKEVQEAIKRPAAEEEIRRQMNKLGNTDFFWKELNITMDEDIFIPVQDINELRRNAVEQLRNEMMKNWQRVTKRKVSVTEVTVSKDMPENTERILTTQIQTRTQFCQVLNCAEVKRIYLDSILYESEEDFLYMTDEDIQTCHEKEKECWYIMPVIFREEKRNYFIKGGKAAEVLSDFDGILVKNLEEIQYLQQIKYRGKIALDHNMYVWNLSSVYFWNREQIDWITLPAELNDKEMLSLKGMKRELIAYGRIPLMVSAQCFQKNTVGCSRKRKTLQLKDRKNKNFYVKNDCSFCYNVIYNSAVTELADQRKEIDQIAPESVRLSFTTEDEKQVREVLQRYRKAFINQETVEMPREDFTRGHWKRGVE